MRPRKVLRGNQDVVWLAVCTGICAVFVVALLGYLEHRHHVYQLGYEAAELTHEHSRLLEENRRLMVEAAVQANAERLELEAVYHLGLRPIESEQVLKDE